ncbi:hypothetical protein HUU59_10950 [bacterium]|nr:hypothetical protein [bacterium]
MSRLKLTRSRDSRILAADKSGKVLEVMTIKVGLSKNRSPEGVPFFYSKEMLQQLMPQFEGLPAYVFENPDGSKGHVRDESDDAKRATGFVKNKVGVYRKPRWGKDSEGNEGIICDLHLVDDELAKRIKNAWDSGFKDFAELSIDGDGAYELTRVEGIDVANGFIESVHSCDIVDSAAAGGKILRIAASNQNKGKRIMKGHVKRLLIRILEARAAASKSAKTEARLTRFLEAEGDDATTVAAEVLQEQSDEMAGEVKWQDIAKEALTALESGNTEAAAAALKKLLDYETAQAAQKNTDTKPSTEPKKEDATPKPDSSATNGGSAVKPEDINALKETVENLQKTLADEKAVAEIDGSNLPAPVKEKLKESVRGRGLELMKVKEAITAEAKALEALGYGSNNGTIRSLNDVGVSDAVLALDGFFAGQDLQDDKKRTVRRFSSIKEAAYKGFRVDRELVDNADLFLGLLASRQYNSELRRNPRFKESFTTASFDQVFGDAMHRALMREYMLPDYRDFEKISVYEEVSDFRDHNFVRLGYWGELPTVDPDGGNFNNLPALGDEQVALNLETRGGLFSITRKMIVNDDMKAIRVLPIRAARALKLRPYRAVFGLLAGNSTIYDSVALLHSNHSNLTSGALTPTTMKDVRKKMYMQPAYGSDSTNPERLMESNWPKWLVIHPDYEDMALALCKAQNTVQVALAAGGYNAGDLLPNGGAPNVHSQYGMDYILYPGYSNAAHWHAIADPKKVESIVVATLRGQSEPDLMQEVAGSGSNFTADKVSYRVRWDVGVKCVDYRGVAGYYA